MNTTDPELEQILESIFFPKQTMVDDVKRKDEAAQAIQKWAAKQELRGRIDELMKLLPFRDDYGEGIPINSVLYDQVSNVKDRLSQLQQELDNV